MHKLAKLTVTIPTKSSVTSIHLLPLLITVGVIARCIWQLAFIHIQHLSSAFLQGTQFPFTVSETKAE